MKEKDAEFEVFQDFWQWYKAHHEVEDRREWWDELIKSGTDFWAKYGGTEHEGLAKDLVMVGCNECERRANRRNGIEMQGTDGDTKGEEK